jgi:hypothetical protein
VLARDRAAVTGDEVGRFAQIPAEVTDPFVPGERIGAPLRWQMSIVAITSSTLRGTTTPIGTWR